MDKKATTYFGKSQFMAEVNALLSANVGTRVNGNVASGKTQRTRSEVLRTCMSNVWDLGYHISNPNKLDTRHITALCVKWHAAGISNKTMQSRLSTLRIMSRWLGKPNLVKSLPEYLPDVDKSELKVRTATQFS